MTTSTMPQRVMALAEEKGIDWNVFRNGFDAHRLDYDAGRITLDEMYALIWRDAGLKVSAETNAAFLKADDESWCYRNERTLECDTVVVSFGIRKDPAAVAELAAVIPETYVIGDCSPVGGTVWPAVRSGFDMAMEL